MRMWRTASFAARKMSKNRNKKEKTSEKQHASACLLRKRFFVEKEMKNFSFSYCNFWTDTV